MVNTINGIIMNAQLLRACRLLATVHSVEIFRLKQGDDHVYLHTNLPNPKAPYTGGLALHLTVDRGTGTDWVHNNFPGVETHLYDHTIGRILAHNPAPSSSSVEEDSQPAVVAAA